MGKASSAKKVARAARAGGRRTGRRRQLGFPVAIGAVVILGLLLVVVAREGNQASADATNPPKRGEHWHASYGVYVCDRFLTNVSDKGSDALGIHTHDDGLIHIHPFSNGAAGKQANMGKFFDQVGMKVGDSAITLPSAEPFDGRLYQEGETTCGGKAATVKIVRWKSALEAAEGAKPTKTFTEDFGKVRFTEDLGAYTIAFVPKGVEVPAPPGASEILQNAQNDAGAGPADPGAVDPGAVDPGAVDPGAVDPGAVDPGSTLPTDTIPPETAPASETSAPG
jgi:hypothetical protein